jgi:hypothetical protein
MQRNPVTSSNIKSIGHDPQNRTLHVEFNSGKVYEYGGVSAGEHAALVNADSVGKHFNEHIKAHYQGTPVESDNG